MNRTTGIVVMGSVAVLSVVILAAAYLFTHKPEPEPMSPGEKLIQQVHEERVACLEGGGTWSNPSGVSIGGSCVQSNVQPPAPASAVAPAEDGGGGGNGCFGQITIGDCMAAKQVKSLVYKNTGYHLTTSIDGIVSAGHQTCPILGPNPTESELDAMAQTTADALNVSQYVGLHVVIAMYGSFCV